MKYVWATGTDQGRVRERNEDAVFPADAGSSDGRLLVGVADGMGGHIAGNVASHIAAEAVTADAVDEETAVGERVSAANEAILGVIEEDPDLNGMGTTMTLGLFDGDGTLRMGHVGDSRAYLVHEGEMRQITQDHTVVAELVELGRLTRADAEHHPQRHLLTRSLGLGPVAVDELAVDLEVGDRVLICSDGLTTMLGDNEIAALLRSETTVEATVWNLIEAANSAGGLDNISVAVIDVR